MGLGSKPENLTDAGVSKTAVIKVIPQLLEKLQTEYVHTQIHTQNGIFSSVAQSCPTLCDPVDLSTPGPPVHHQLLEFTQTHAQ